MNQFIEEYDTFDDWSIKQFIEDYLRKHPKQKVATISLSRVMHNGSFYMFAIVVYEGDDGS